MHRRPRPVLQAVLHRPLDDGRHALPVQPILARRPLPTQLPRQSRYGIRQRRRHSRPGLGPGKVLHPHPATRALDAARTVAQLQRQIPHRQISPLPLLAHAVDLTASLPAESATQQPITQPVDVDDHKLRCLLHLGHCMRFQSQLFSDKRLDEHLDPLPFVVEQQPSKG